MRPSFAPPMRLAPVHAKVISICIPPFADRCIGSLRCSRPTTAIFARFLSAAAGQRNGRRRAPYRSGRHLHPLHLRKVRRAKRHPGAGESDAVRRHDLSLFAAADAAIRAWISDAPLPPRDKAPVDYFLVEESIIKREGNLRSISRRTLKTSPRSRRVRDRPPGRKTLGGAAHAPRISSFPMPGSPTGQRAGLLSRRCPSPPATSLKETP